MAASKTQPRQGEEQDNGADAAQVGEKHQLEHESPKNEKQQKRQTTLDESLGGQEKTEEIDKQADEQSNKSQDQSSGTRNDKDQSGESEDRNNEDEENPEVTQNSTSKGNRSSSKNKNAEHAVESKGEKNVPSSILEKGIIYFFIRGRVGIDEPGGVNDIARTYIMLRPIPKDAKLGHGTIGDAGNTRLIALPKKVLPESGKDRFLVFVEKSGASFEEIKTDFLASSDYDTKTAGSRHIPAAGPVGEGVYAITTTGRESHLAYILTLPTKLGSAQQELGLKEKGSFVLSTKNPEHESPANAQLPEDPKFPKEIIDEFRSLRWMPSKPAHLDYVNSQVLLIGESSGINKATEPSKKDVENGKQEPVEVLEHLEEEDKERMKNLPGDQAASVFADLEALSKGNPPLKSSF